MWLRFNLNLLERNRALTKVSRAVARRPLVINGSTRPVPELNSHWRPVGQRSSSVVLEFETKANFRRSFQHHVADRYFTMSVKGKVNGITSLAVRCVVGNRGVPDEGWKTRRLEKSERHGLGGHQMCSRVHVTPCSASHGPVFTMALVRESRQS